MEGARSEAQRRTRLVGQGSRGHVAVVDFNSKPETSAMERGEKEERAGGGGQLEGQPEERQDGQVVNWVFGGRA